VTPILEAILKDKSDKELHKLKNVLRQYADEYMSQNEKLIPIRDKILRVLDNKMSAKQAFKNFDLKAFAQPSNLDGLTKQVISSFRLDKKEAHAAVPGWCSAVAAGDEEEEVIASTVKVEKVKDKLLSLRKPSYSMEPFKSEEEFSEWYTKIFVESDRADFEAHICLESYQSGALSGDEGGEGTSLLQGP
jgi:hypothetical protein